MCVFKVFLHFECKDAVGHLWLEEKKLLWTVNQNWKPESSSSTVKAWTAVCSESLNICAPENANTKINVKDSTKPLTIVSTIITRYTSYYLINLEVIGSILAWSVG